MGTRHLVLSDMHFGTPQSSINDHRFREPLVTHIASGAPWKEIVFTGDLLDANLSTLRQAIEGRSRNGADEVIGFRSFLEAIDGAMRNSGRGLAEVAESWVYVPGNHDYKIWDLLATRLAFEDVLQRGQRLGSVPMPLAEHQWPAGTSFFAGIFRPFGADGRVSVEYPNHLATFGDGADVMLFTHGHYLDSSQTRGNDLAAHLARADAPPDPSGVVRQIVIETAQYQAVASAVSYTQDARRLVDGLVGPDGLVAKLHRLAAAVGSWILKVLFAGDSSMRGEALSAKQLANADIYVTRFCKLPRRPRWFVFGHTHRQGQDQTTGPAPMRVYNVGSCYPDRGLPITFLQVDGRDGKDPEIQLMCVDGAGVVRRSQG